MNDEKSNDLYTRKQYVLTYLRVTPIGLLSHNEQRNLIQQLTASLSSLQTSFKFIVVPRPVDVDITPFITDLFNLLLTKYRTQKEILKLAINEMIEVALSGVVVEREFYIALWEKESEDVEQNLRVKAQELIARFAENNIMLEHVKQREIIELFRKDTMNDEKSNDTGK